MDDQEFRALMAYAGLEVASDDDYRRLKVQFQISLAGRDVLDQLDLHDIIPITTGPLYPSRREEP